MVCGFGEVVIFSRVVGFCVYVFGLVTIFGCVVVVDVLGTVVCVVGAFVCVVVVVVVVVAVVWTTPLKIVLKLNGSVK